MQGRKDAFLLKCEHSGGFGGLFDVANGKIADVSANVFLDILAHDELFHNHQTAFIAERIVVTSRNRTIELIIPSLETVASKHLIGNAIKRAVDIAGGGLIWGINRF